MHFLSEFHYISIHSLRGEGDDQMESVRLAWHYFNPLPPWGGRRVRVMGLLNRVTYFNPLPPWGGRQSQKSTLSPMMVFQSTPSVGRETDDVPF